LKVKHSKLRELAKPRQGDVDFQEEVRRRAYQIYEQRGMVVGFEMADWLQAEAEVLEARKPTQSAA
jgi:hypothetical protein